MSMLGIRKEKKGAKIHNYNLKEEDVEYLYDNTRYSREDIREWYM